MRFVDRMTVSLRHIRGRMVESILVVLATAVGVALVAAMAAFIRSYNDQTEYLLSHPAYRELLVEAVGSETELDEPAVEYDPEVSSEVSLGYDDITAALENTTMVAHGYVADRQELSTELFGGRGAGVAMGAGMERLAGAGPPGEGVDGGIVMEMPEGAPPPGFPGSEEASGAIGTADGESAENPFDAFRRQMQSPAEGGEAGEPGAPPQFDLEEFFAVEDDVLTELPLDSFAGRSISVGFLEAYGLEISEGSGLTQEDLDSGNQVLVLGSSLAETLFPDGDAVGTRVRLGMQTYTVIGILEATELADTETGASYNDIAFIPNGDAQISFGGRTINRRRPIRTLRFAVADSADLETAATELEAHFVAEYGDGAVNVTAPLEEMTTEREKLGRILSVVLFLAAAGLFIASINLFNLMLMRVIKRTKGIGITRAMGATRNDIFRQFLNESAMMSVLGAVVGLVASPFVYRMLESALVTGVSGSALVNWPFLVVGALAAFVFSLIFGVIPARQASGIDAALAIRSE